MWRNNNWSRNYISGPGQQRKQQLPLVTRDKARRAGAAARHGQDTVCGKGWRASQVDAAAAVWQAQVLSGV